MKKNQKNVNWVRFVLFFSITKISFDFFIIEPISNSDDYFNKISPKQYEIVPNNDLNNSNDINKIDDFHYYFDDYDYYYNYKDFQYHDKKDDYYDHHYYEGYE